MDNKRGRLAKIEASERVLILPHCLRQSNRCQAKYDSQGLQCAGCSSDCAIKILRNAALKARYKGVCVAPGGNLALKYVKEKQPEAIVAVACEKELREGIQGVKALTEIGNVPLIVIVPLIKEGCVDTEVDVNGALETILTGCIMVEV